MKRFFLLISLLVSLILSIPEIAVAGSCSGELYVCANCCTNDVTKQSYDCYKCSSSGSTAVTCGPGTHACIGSCFSGGSCCCDNGTNLPDDDPGYTARPNCPTPLKPDDTGKTPIYASNVSTPITFSWKYNGGWGKRTNDKQYIYGILDITRRIMGFDGSWVKQTVTRFSDSNYDGYLANTYTWHPPLHYRYITAYDNVDYLYSSGDWSLQFSSDPSQMLDGSVSMTNIKGATAEREISLFGEGGFVVRYVARPFGGKMRVSIDGVEAGIIDQEANRDECGWQVEWKKANVPT